MHDIIGYTLHAHASKVIIQAHALNVDAYACYYWLYA